MNLPDSSILTNIHFPGKEKPGDDVFEKIYISVRSIENRLYTDQEVEYLPEIARGHTHYREWLIRKKTSRRLFSYLSAKKKRLRIMEVGCGNGWLAHLLAGIPGAEVTGLDINFTELQQAARVFNEDRHLRFIYGDIYSGVLARLKFDIIVFSASIQYFQSFRKIINGCQRNLAPGGEIHIINSPFYPAAELGPAKKRTQEYYHSLGYPEMADYYFHHPIGDLKAFTHTVIYNPSSILNKLIRNPDPFLWVCIKND